MRDDLQCEFARVGESVPGLVGNWSEAEALAAVWSRRLGFPDARLTAPGADNGIDVASRGSVAQVKWFSRKRVGIDKVQRLHGGAKPGQKSLFFSSPSGYTMPAIIWAFDPDNRVALFHLHPDGTITAVNWHAFTALWRAPYSLPAHLVPPIPIWAKALAFGLCFPFLIAQIYLAVYVAVFDGWTLAQLVGQVISAVMLAMWWIPVALVCRRDLRRLRTAVRARLRGERWPGWKSIVTDPPVEVPSTERPACGFLGYDPGIGVRLVYWCEAMGYAGRYIGRKWAARRRVAS